MTATITHLWDSLPLAVRTRAKAIAAAVGAAVGAYVVSALIHGDPWTLHGIEDAAGAAVLAGIGVHQVRNAVAPTPTVDRLELLPAPTGKRLGHLPSPRDDRDYRYQRDDAKATLTCHNAAGLTFAMLGNDRLGDCAEAGEEHGRQVVAHLRGLTYTPTLDGTVSLYEAAAGYVPGNPATDQGTVLRQLLDTLRKQGVISEYQAVGTDVASLRSAVATHGYVLAGFALPTGAESEGVKWTVPRVGKVAGSWGCHCVPLVGSTSETFDLVSWGQVGTASQGFVRDYLDEAWVVTYADTAL